MNAILVQCVCVKDLLADRVVKVGSRTQSAKQSPGLNGSAMESRSSSFTRGQATISQWVRCHKHTLQMSHTLQQILTKKIAYVPQAIYIYYIEYVDMCVCRFLWHLLQSCLTQKRSSTYPVHEHTREKERNMNIRVHLSQGADLFITV